VKVGVVRFPGSNCDMDCVRAVAGLGAEPALLWHRSATLADIDVVVLPGGFSYGDYLRAGAIARLSPIMDRVAAFARAGGPVLGVCNGFQVLCEAGLLPGALVRNRTLRFRCLDVHIRVESHDTPFTTAYECGDRLRLPIAHGQGQFVASEEVLTELEEERRVVFRYVNPAGETTPEANPNGSAHHIAGICSREGNVLGLMPHPERAVSDLLCSSDGLGVFRSLLAIAGAAT